jgi:ribonucleoside-diphosphate reductase alpha chain
VSFMRVFDAICSTVAAAGHRRGAQMGVLRVDHPDVIEFIQAKRSTNNGLTNFNLSVGVTNEFMECLATGRPFDLRFEGRTIRTVDPQELWDAIMASTWDWAEPGVLFLNTMNEWNNLWYCEDIRATNPCSEQPLPPYGACLLGSFNLTKYLSSDGTHLNLQQLEDDVQPVVAAMDNVINVAKFPLPEQQREAATKRRMGIGVMGLANALECQGHSYGSPSFLKRQSTILSTIKNHAYLASAKRAMSHGACEAFERDAYCNGKFIKTLDSSVRAMIRKYGVRNSHLTSIAPTGTIAITADNISGGVEPVFEHEYTRKMHTPEGVQVFEMQDWAYRVHGVKGRTANELSVQEHLDVLVTAQNHVDSAVSKTCNVGASVGYDEFKQVYQSAWERGAKGCTTFRAAGKLMGVLEAKKPAAEPEPELVGAGEACHYDPATGTRTCE